jgi:integrase
MAIETDKLTSLALKHLARENAPARKYFDGAGLYLDVRPNGARYWRMKYRFAGQEKLMAMGTYPEVSLAEARRRRDEARTHLRGGINPMAAKSDQKASDRRIADASFSIVSKAWLATKQNGWSADTFRKAVYVTDTYLIPALRRHSIATLKSKDAADSLQGIPPSLARKARQYLCGIVNYAIHQELREEGRLLSLKGALPKYEKGHIPGATDPANLRAVIKAIDEYAIPVTRAALTLAMLTAQRPGLVAAAEWEDFDLDAGEWSLPGPKMKMRRPHIVPLPRQAVELLHQLMAWTGGKRYVFPPLARQKTEHLHRDTLSKALREMGFQGKHAPHGFRTTLRTIARERLRVDPDVLEAQLAHAKKGDVQQAYDRTEFNDERRVVMQKWANYLDKLRTIGPVEQRKAA